MHLAFTPDTPDTPDTPIAPDTSFDTFLKVDVRVGTVVDAAPLEGARKSAHRMVIDFGPVVGQKKSSAQITEHYSPETLIGRQVVCVVNFPPRQIGSFRSEVLTLGFADQDGAIRLITVDEPVPNGTRMS